MAMLREMKKNFWESFVLNKFEETFKLKTNELSCNRRTLC